MLLARLRAGRRCRAPAASARWLVPPPPGSGSSSASLCRVTNQGLGPTLAGIASLQRRPLSKAGRAALPSLPFLPFPSPAGRPVSRGSSRPRSPADLPASRRRSGSQRARVRLAARLAGPRTSIRRDWSSFLLFYFCKARPWSRGPRKLEAAFPARETCKKETPPPTHKYIYFCILILHFDSSGTDKPRGFFLALSPYLLLTPFWLAQLQGHSRDFPPVGRGESWGKVGGGAAAEILN